ncbi:NAD(+) synthase [Clostridium paraputrificum]|uniref:NAD(+) synthase n=1 Tax=Clostridium paraputrificum TaxID=29363 RepID=UPI003D326C51
MRKGFNAKKEAENIIKWIKEYFNNQPGAKGAVIGISGGKDSTVVSKLLVEALGRENVFGVLMPNGEQKDIEDSIRVVENLKINYKVVNIEQAYKGILAGINEELSNQAKVNIPPRLRMTTVYAIAATMDYRVAGTGNKSEGYVGYTTKWGDSAYDFNPIGDLTTEEVVAVGDALGLPYELVHKAPSDGLTGKTDEDNLGFTYKQVNQVIENGSCGNTDIDKKIKRKYQYNQHKREMPIKYLVEQK